MMTHIQSQDWSFVFARGKIMASTVVPEGLDLAKMESDPFSFRRWCFWLPCAESRSLEIYRRMAAEEDAKGCIE